MVHHGKKKRNRYLNKSVVVNTSRLSGKGKLKKEYLEEETDAMGNPT